MTVVDISVKLKTILVISAIGGTVAFLLLVLLLSKYGSDLELGAILVWPIVYYVGMTITTVTTFIKIKESIVGKLLSGLISLLIYMIIFNLLAKLFNL